MLIQLNGYGVYMIEKARYKEFIEILNLDNDIFLEAIQMQKEYEIVPILSINTQNINREGPLPYSHRKTELGIARMSELIQKEIISPYNPEG